MNNIHFIGAGHLARCLIEGLSHATTYRLSVSSPTVIEKASFKSLLTHTSNTHFLPEANMVILAVKPDKIQTVCQEISAHVTHEQIIVSLAAGVKRETIQECFATAQPVVRVMPNIAAEYNQSATALYGDNLSASQHLQVETLFNTLGLSTWVASDHHIDIATALAGSSPAFLYQFIDALIEPAVKAGLPEDTATALAAQAMFGAIDVARQSKQDYSSLSKQVASKKGTTEAGLSYLKQHDMRDIVGGALMAAIKRARALSQDET